MCIIDIIIIWCFQYSLKNLYQLKNFWNKTDSIWFDLISDVLMLVKNLKDKTNICETMTDIYTSCKWFTKQRNALKVLPALLGGYVFLNTKGSQIVRLLLCLKFDPQPELGSGLPSRWKLRPTLPGSRVTRKDWRLTTLAWSKCRSRKKKTFTHVYNKNNAKDTQSPRIEA